MTDFDHFELFCATAGGFWRNNVQPDGERVILVEALHQDRRVTLRNLTIANAIRRITPARMVVYGGTDEDWTRILWTYFDGEANERMCRSYGASDVFDIQKLVDDLVSETPPESFTIAGHTFTTSELRSAIDPEVLETCAHATAARVLQVPRISAADRESPEYRRIQARSAAFSKLYDSMIEALDPVAVVTSHVDYNHWGLAVESAQRLGVPVVHVQTTGTLKAYTLFPESRTGALPFRGELTKQIADYFHSHVWPHRAELRRSAELTAWRNKSNLGRPSWWRGGGAHSSVEFRTDAERADLRVHAAARLGFDPGKPVIAVYNHAISDALGTNVEMFTDLAEWFERTAEFAAAHDEVNWLLIDHPAQFLYDSTDFFGTLAEKHAGLDHVRFIRSMSFSKNLQWSLVDLGVTVRGSVSNELPAFGIPCIQAGWSEWSDLDISLAAKDQDDYWRLLEESIGALVAGQRLVTEEQIEKARLWMWFYRSATDVPSVFVQQWEIGGEDPLWRALRLTMQYVEPDHDPVFESVHRMWTRCEPILTRFDLDALDPRRLNMASEGASASALADIDPERPGPRLLTSFDPEEPHQPVPGEMVRGDQPALRVVDGFARGGVVVGRFGRSPGLLGIKLKPERADQRISVSLDLVFDAATPTWWQDRVPAEVEPRTPLAPRVLLVSSMGQPRVGLLVARAGRQQQRVTAGFDLAPGEVSPDGLMVCELVSPANLPAWAQRLTASHGLVGLQLERMGFAFADQSGAADATAPFATATAHPVQSVPTTPPQPYHGLLVVNPTSAGPTRQWRARVSAATPLPAPRPASAARPAPRRRGLPERAARKAARTVLPPEGRRMVRGVLRRAKSGVATLQRTRRSMTSTLPAPAAAPSPADTQQQVESLVAELAHRGQLSVRTVGLITGTESTWQAEATEPGTIEAVGGTAFSEPVLAQIDLAGASEDVVRTLEKAGAVWQHAG